MIELDDYLKYEKETGKLIWRKSYWVSRIGTEAGHIASDGYKVITLKGKNYKAHIVAFYLMTGVFPDSQIDHINGKRDDNRWVNLRQVSATQNQQNRRLNANNKSGRIGVSWIQRDRKWMASINRSGKRVTLGLFERIGDAVEARDKAEKDLHYHVNHGSQTSE